MARTLKTIRAGQEVTVGTGEEADVYGTVIIMAGGIAEIYRGGYGTVLDGGVAIVHDGADTDIEVGGKVIYV